MAEKRQGGEHDEVERQGEGEGRERGCRAVQPRREGLAHQVFPGGEHSAEQGGEKSHAAGLGGVRAKGVYYTVTAAAARRARMKRTGGLQFRLYQVAPELLRSGDGDQTPTLGSEWQSGCRHK